MIVDRAIYIDGIRSEVSDDSFDEMYETCEARGGMAWIGLYQPTEEEFARVTAEFALHPLAIEDAVHAHQRPKLEWYGDTLFVVLRAARYLDAPETVEFSELHVFTGPNFVITVRHGNGPDLGLVRKRMESNPDLLRLGPRAVLYAILDRVVDDYNPVVFGLENDIDEIENQVFSGNAEVTRRTYELTREVIDFQRATKPLPGILAGLISGMSKQGAEGELRRYLRDVRDHTIRIYEQAQSFRDLLQNILSVNLTLVGLQQNEDVRAMTEASIRQGDEVKRISAWAAILFAPTLVPAIYGMNFERMPELDWTLGYPMALALMVSSSVVIYIISRKKGWLS
jgi:magnesium transporter